MDNVKESGYWQNKENCINETMKYYTKNDLIQNSKSCYNAVRENGWLNELCSGYTKTQKYRDVNEKIHVVYVYEMDDFKTCYVGRTVDLHKRDLGHRRGRKHSNGTITYDSLYLFCENKGISIPQPKILESNLTGEESLDKEDFWLKEYQTNGWTTLNIAKTGKNSGSLGAVMKWDYESCKEFASHYEYKTDLRKANCTCYAVCLKNNWLEEFGIKDKKDNPNGTWNDLDKCLQEAEKYDKRSDFMVKSYGCYHSMLKHDWLDLLPDKLKLKEVEELNFDEIYAEYQRCKNVNIVAKKYGTYYKKIKKMFDEHGVRLDGHGDIELTDEILKKILEMYENGNTIWRIAFEIKMSKRRIKKIIDKYKTEKVED